METQIDELVVLLGLVAALGVAYAKTFAPYQEAITQAIVDAARVGTRYKRLTNLAVGEGMAIAFSALGAWVIGDWTVLALGVIAGLLSSVEAARVHDTQAA